MRRARVWWVRLSALVLLSVVMAGNGSAQVLPVGFVDEAVVSGLDLPTAFTVLPDGRMLIAQKDGLVRVVKNENLLPTPFIDLRSSVNDYWDHGLLGIAADRDFAVNRFVYLYYVYENDSSDYGGIKTSRVTRVTATGDVASPASQVIILGTQGGAGCQGLPADADCIQVDSPSHSVGDIKVANDGTLFLTHGDGASFNVVDDLALRAQGLNTLHGKVIHITTTGAGLPENPFWNGNPNANRSKVWALGMRNPYRFALHPTSGALYIGDVGWDTYEEVNVVPAGAPGANFGWPCYEGVNRQPGYEPLAGCQTLYAAGASAVKAPLIPYPHDAVTAAVTGGTFYNGASFPAQYHGAFFYGDYATGFLRYLRVDDNGVMSGPLTGFAVDLGGPVYISTDGENLVYAAINTGQVRRIRYTGANPEVSYLSDRTWTTIANGFGPVERDQSNGADSLGDGRIITLNTQEFAKGLGGHAPSDIRFALNASCTTFAATVGVDDYVGSGGSIVFQVFGDGVSLYTSPTLTGTSTSQSVNVSVAGRNELRLVISDSGNGNTLDHGDWANARVTCSVPADITPPTVTVVSPPAFASGVAVGTNVTGTFSEAMSAATLTTATVTLTTAGSGPVPAVVTYSASTQTVTLDPTAPILTGRTYTATIKGGSSGAKDAAGNPLASDKVWTFVTTATETTPPTVTNVSPTSGALDLPSSVNAVATFSEAMDPATITTASFTIVRQGTTTVLAGAVSYNGSAMAATLDPAAPLLVNTTYTVTVKGGSAGVKDAAGNALAVDRVWNFTTAPAATSSYLSDLTWFSMTNGWGPVERDRSNGENGDADGGTLTINGVTYAKGLGGHAPSDLRYTLNGGCGVFTAVVGLDDEVGSAGSVVFQVWVDGVQRYDSGLMTGSTAAKNVNVNVSGGVELQLVMTGAGDGTVADHADWADAQVNCGVDTIPPTVSSTSPTPNATGVAVAATITGTFSEAMDPNTLSTATATVTPEGRTTALPATVSYNSATRTVTIDPLSNLTGSTLHTALIKGGATGVKDVAGNPLALDRVWNFTTAPAGSATYLSDLTWTSMTNGWGPAERDRSNGELGAADGGPLVINGVSYPKGLGVHAASDIRYPLNGTCSTFTAVVGVDDEVGTAGSVIFQVLVNGIQRYDSGVMTGTTAAKSVTVDISGGTELRLLVNDAANGTAGDHGDWADAQLSCVADSGAPTVTATSPTANATGVSLAVNVTATFSEAMTASTLTATSVTLTAQGPTPVAAAISYDAASRTVTLDPSASLIAGTIYTATIKGGSSGAQDLSGNPLAADVVWTFTTNNRPVPTITQPLSTFKFKVGDVMTYAGSATDAEDGTIPGANLRWDVILHHCPGGTCHQHPFTNSTGTSGQFTAPDHGDESFFEVMLTATDSTGLTGVGSVIIQPQTVQLTLDTSVPGLQVVYGGTAATAPATFTTIVGSTHTIFAPSPQNGVSFTAWSDGGSQQHNIIVGASNMSVVASFGPADVTPPTVTTVSPVSGATGVATSTNVTGIFSEAMNATTISATTVFLTAQGSASPIAATVLYDAATRTVTLDPTGTLAANTVHTATIKGGSSGVKDAAGNPLAVDRVWMFTTASGGGGVTFLSDLTWTSMTNGWGPVERDRSNGEMGATDGHPLTLNGVVYTKGLGTHAVSDVRYGLGGACSVFTAVVGVDDEVASGGSVVFQVLVDGVQRYDSGLMTATTASKTVSVSVTGGSELRLVVTAGGDGSVADHGDWADAQVACGADTTAPTVTVISPTASATGIAASTNVTATFSEAMNATTVSATTVFLTAQGSASPIAATVLYDAATRTVTLDPTATLAANTVYTATIKGGSSGVKDAAGNPLAVDQVWTFTTVSSGGGVTYLSDLTWTSMTNGWGPVERDRSNGEIGAADGAPLTLNGVVYAKGLGTHAVSDVRYGLGAPAACSPRSSGWTTRSRRAGASCSRCWSTASSATTAA